MLWGWRYIMYYIIFHWLDNLSDNHSITTTITTRHRVFRTIPQRKDSSCLTHPAHSFLTPLPHSPSLRHLFTPSSISIAVNHPAIPSKEYTSYCDDPVCLHPGKNSHSKRRRRCDAPLTRCVWQTKNKKSRWKHDPCRVCVQRFKTLGLNQQ